SELRALPLRRAFTNFGKSWASGNRCFQYAGCAIRIVSRIASWHQFVATGLRHQYLGIGRILLDLLAQAINVGLQSVGGDTLIVTPDFLQQRLARHRQLSGPVQEAKDRSFLLGQSYLSGVG